MRISNILLLRLDTWRPNYNSLKLGHLVEGVHYSLHYKYKLIVQISLYFIRNTSANQTVS